MSRKKFGGLIVAGTKDNPRPFIIHIFTSILKIIIRYVCTHLNKKHLKALVSGSLKRRKGLFLL